MVMVKFFGHLLPRKLGLGMGKKFIPLVNVPGISLEKGISGFLNLWSRGPPLGPFGGLTNLTGVWIPLFLPVANFPGKSGNFGPVFPRDPLERV